jgi:hypothetical protein
MPREEIMPILKALQQLAKKHGTPLFVYSSQVLDRKDAGVKFIARPDPAAHPPAGAADDEPSELVTDFVEIPPGHAVEGMAVPPGFVGRGRGERVLVEQ